jgi:hypothetical protein
VPILAEYGIAWLERKTTYAVVVMVTSLMNDSDRFG